MKKLLERCINCFCFRDEDGSLVDLSDFLQGDAKNRFECRIEPPKLGERLIVSNGVARIDADEFGHWPGTYAMYGWCHRFIPRRKVLASEGEGHPFEVVYLHETDWSDEC